MSGLQPRTLDILGEDFSSVDSVLINGVEAADVIILSPVRLLAQVPSEVLDRVASVQVVSRTLAITDKAKIRFRLGKSTTKVGGILRLCQVFLKILFTTPGTDIWTPEIGGAALQILGKNEGEGLAGDFVLAVDRAAKQVRSIQAPDTRLPLTEKLLKATVLGVQYNRTEQALLPNVELINQTGQPAWSSCFCRRNNMVEIALEIVGGFALGFLGYAGIILLMGAMSGKNS